MTAPTKRLCKPSKRITVGMLRARDACPEQIIAFKKQWPGGANVTAPNIRRAVELGLDVCWLGNYFLKGEIYTDFVKEDHWDGNENMITHRIGIAKKLIEIWGLE